MSEGTPEKPEIAAGAPEGDTPQDASASGAEPTSGDVNQAPATPRDLPPGATMNSEGRVTGTRTKDGRYIPLRTEKKLPMHPRRVRGGIKLRKEKDAEAEPNWVTQRITRLIEEAADGEVLREGVEYAGLGQTKKLEIEDGVIVATVQGRRTRPYQLTIRLPQMSEAEAERLVESMSDQARYAAKLLAGELPRDVEDLFAPLGLHLFPTGPGELEIECTCKEEVKPWCKHAVCVMTLMAQRLGDDPFVLFELRGLPGEELLERLRERRALAGQGESPEPVYQPRVPGASDSAWAGLEEELEQFWDAPDGGEVGAGVDLPMAEPEVRHALLRRLGKSPFEGRFPLVGLLETCYSMISEETLKAKRAEDAEGAGEDDGDGGSDRGSDEEHDGSA